MAEFMAAGHFQRHIRRMRRAALSRRNTLLAGWPKDIPGIGNLPSVAAGLHLTVAVDSQARERELVEKAASVDVEINALSSYWLPDTQTPVDQRAGPGFCGGTRGGDQCCTRASGKSLALIYLQEEQCIGQTMVDFRTINGNGLKCVQAAVLFVGPA
jgi:hypothetical protein